MRSGIKIILDGQHDLADDIGIRDTLLCRLVRSSRLVSVGWHRVAGEVVQLNIYEGRGDRHDIECLGDGVLTEVQVRSPGLLVVGVVSSGLKPINARARNIFTRIQLVSKRTKHLLDSKVRRVLSLYRIRPDRTVSGGGVPVQLLVGIGEATGKGCLTDLGVEKLDEFPLLSIVIHVP